MGFRPVCAIYSTFLQRAFDPIVHDVCLQNLPVVFCMDRGDFPAMTARPITDFSTSAICVAFPTSSTWFQG